MGELGVQAGKVTMMVTSSGKHMTQLSPLASDPGLVLDLEMKAPFPQGSPSWDHESYLCHWKRGTRLGMETAQRMAEKDREHGVKRKS